MPLILGANSLAGGYQVKNSLRFNSGSSDKLNRTASSGSGTKYTASCWVKRSCFDSSTTILSTGDTSPDNNARMLFINADNRVQVAYYNAGYTYQVETSALLRDPSAWYHLVASVDTTQATSSNRVQIYINGTLQTSLSTASYPSQNATFNFNSATQYIGDLGGRSIFSNFYLADFYYIDGTQLSASSFGETDTDTGIWKPKAYTGTYGTNGFYLKFGSSSALGTDSSGNGNTFTVNNLTSIDQTTDTPTNNFCTSNPLDKDSSLTLTEGNLKCASPNDSTFRGGRSTFGITTGKWYWEVKASTVVSGDARAYVGISTQQYTNFTTYLGANAYGWGYYSNDGNKSNSGTQSAYGASWSTNDIIGVAFDATNGTLIFYKNGTSQGTAFTGITGDTYFPTVTNYCQGGSEASVLYNFGNPPYSANSYTDGAGYGNFSYAVPSGYYSLCTKNLAQYG